MEVEVLVWIFFRVLFKYIGILLVSFYFRFDEIVVWFIGFVNNI